MVDGEGGAASGERLSPLLTIAVSISLIAVIIAVTVCALLSPAWTHFALRAAGSVEVYGNAGRTFKASDAVTGDLLDPSGRFDLRGPLGTPLFDAAERAHLVTVRRRILAALGCSILGALAIGGAIATSSRSWGVWKAVGWGGAVSLALLSLAGVLGLLRFDLAFRLFHAVLFPKGGFSFDPRTDMIVRLYPPAFWQLTGVAAAILGTLLGAVALFLGRLLGRARGVAEP